MKIAVTIFALLITIVTSQIGPFFFFFGPGIQSVSTAAVRSSTDLQFQSGFLVDTMIYKLKIK